jgi:hypothetical protein
MGKMAPPIHGGAAATAAGSERCQRAREREVVLPPNHGPRRDVGVGERLDGVVGMDLAGPLSDRLARLIARPADQCRRGKATNHKSRSNVLVGDGETRLSSGSCPRI